MIRQVAQCRLALRVEPAFSRVPSLHSRLRVADRRAGARCAAASEADGSFCIRERDSMACVGGGTRRAQHSGIEIKKSSNEKLRDHAATARSINSDLEFHACVCQHPCFAPAIRRQRMSGRVVHRAHDLFA